VNKAVFLDRDGVINEPIVKEGKPFAPTSMREFKLFAETLQCCCRLKSAGYLLVVVTNQPDVGRKKMSQKIVEQMHLALLKKLPIDAIEVCYDSGEQPSLNRKPAIGMVMSAAARLDIELGSSYMIGDRWKDIDCGKAAGCRTIFIDRDYEEELNHTPDISVNSLEEAVQIVLNEKKESK
jgi:D-glycero-D-manno-heptose 1,7-bisphosphate phosphatase